MNNYSITEIWTIWRTKIYKINNRQHNRQQENRNRRTNSITTEERETTVVEPPLPFYKQLTSMSINEEPQVETTNIDNVLVVTIDITQMIITETIGEIHHKENKIKGITLKNDEIKKNIVIITKAE